MFYSLYTELVLCRFINCDEISCPAVTLIKIICIMSLVCSPNLLMSVIVNNLALVSMLMLIPAVKGLRSVWGEPSRLFAVIFLRPSSDN